MIECMYCEIDSREPHHYKHVMYIKHGLIKHMEIGPKQSLCYMKEPVKDASL